MTTSTSVFVGPGSTLGQVAEWIGHMIEHPLTESTNEWGPVYKGSLMGVSITAYADHEFEDDAGIEFSRYPIQVQFTRFAGPDPELRTELARIMAQLAGSVISSELDCECIVVDETQHLLRKYPSPSSETDAD